MNVRIRAVGFDLGDTLLFYRDTPLNWSALYPDALRAVAARCGATPSANQLAAAAEVLGRYNTRLVPRTHEVAAEVILADVLRAWNINDQSRLPIAIEAFFNFFRQRMAVFPETVSVLTALRQKSFPIGVLTDAPYGMPRHLVQRDMEDAGIAGLIDVLMTSVEVAARKPETPGYLALAVRLGVAPSELLYVGNEPKDVIGACRAGVCAALIDRDGKGGPHGQQFTIASLNSVLEIVSSFLG